MQNQKLYCGKEAKKGKKKEKKTDKRHDRKAIMLLQYQNT